MIQKFILAVFLFFRLLIAEAGADNSQQQYDLQMFVSYAIDADLIQDDVQDYRKLLLKAGCLDKKSPLDCKKPETFNNAFNKEMQVSQLAKYALNIDFATFALLMGPNYSRDQKIDSYSRFRAMAMIALDQNVSFLTRYSAGRSLRLAALAIQPDAKNGN